jgi:hypothetical protein
VIWKFFKWTGYLILTLLFIEFLIYFIVPVYDFPVPRPFSGKHIHNPYEGMDSTAWKKTNFHFHLRAWGGMTSGRGNTGELFWNTYRKLGYTLSAVSDYQKINRFNKDSVFYIPAYEHGFGIRKKHQLLIGAKKVLWMDYSLIQNLNHKQHILDLLRPNSEIVALAHPDWEGGYSDRDVQCLTNYDLMEVLDANWRSVPLWDAALSAGRPVYIVADDDAHDILDPYEIGRCCTFVNSGSIAGDALIRSLKNGKAFGAEIYMPDGQSFEDKAKYAKEVPLLNSLTVTNDTLRVRVSTKAIRIVFIGQNGKAKKISYYTDEASYAFQPEDTYIRTEIRFYNPFGGPGTIFYLNPVFRYDDPLPTNEMKAEINWPRTWIFRLFSIPALFFLAFLFIYRRNKTWIRQKLHR